LVSFPPKQGIWSIRMAIEIIKIAMVPTKRCGFDMTWLSQPIKTWNLWGKIDLSHILYEITKNNTHTYIYIYQFPLHYSISRARHHATVPRRAARPSAPAVGFSLPGEMSEPRGKFWRIIQRSVTGG
jgi:hypothetical protein